MPRPSCTFILATICAATASPADNWIKNGDFESDEPVLWASGVIDHEVVHAGKGALRVDMPEGKTKFSARYGAGIELGQSEPSTLMLAFWLRFDAKRQVGRIRGGVTCHVEFEGEPFLAWYGPFVLKPEESGSWVYREARWKPRSPVRKIRPSVYFSGFEGSVYIDDVYLGPPTDLPEVPRRTVPIAITGQHGRFTDWPRFEVLSFEPIAHVFHLSGENQTNLELRCELDVTKPAPIYLTSAWGSQYWTLYCPARRELAEIYTDERLDLSKPGKRTVTLAMCAFSNHAYDLAPGGYAFISDRFKNFLIYSTEKPQGEPYRDARTGQTFSYWDTTKIELLSGAVGPSGVVAPFSLANLSSYELSATARRAGEVVRVTPRLRDGGGAMVPLHGLELTAKCNGKESRLEEQLRDDGAPTGVYLLPERPAPTRVRISGPVRLATPSGVKTERLQADVEVGAAGAESQAALKGLQLVGWGGAHYSLGQGPKYGPQSMRRLVGDAKAAGVPRLVVLARTSRGMCYPSDVALGDKPDWDVMAAAATEGKRTGIAIYAGYILGIAQPTDLKARPAWAMLNKAGKQTGWYCYNHPDVRAYHAAQVAELVTRYDIAGVSLDYCRPGGGCFCERCATLFKQKHGKPLRDVDAYTPQWIEFKRECITQYLRKLAEALRRARPSAKFSGYVWGRLGPERDRAGQDWPKWLADGIMDWVCVGQYTVSSPMFRSQCHTLKLIADKHLNGDTSRIFPLLGVTYIQGAHPSYAASDAVIARHLRAAQEEGLVGAGYFPFYGIRTHTRTSAEHGARRN